MHSTAPLPLVRAASSTLQEKLMDLRPTVAHDADRDAVALMPSEPLVVVNPEWPGMRGRWITATPTDEGWPDFILSEWELEGAAWTDLHHHDEVNLVVEGELHVECDGTTVVAGPGDTVRVPAGRLGRYVAPRYARMVAVYGPNPGMADDAFSYESL
jgi:mannose-6-phosphate isomerase-like protein (cupin superfamily)